MIWKHLIISNYFESINKYETATDSENIGISQHNSNFSAHSNSVPASSEFSQHNSNTVRYTY